MKRLLVLAGVVAVGSASAFDFFELEANDTKAAANNVFGIVAGDTIRGTTTGSSTTVAGIGSADYFRVKTAAAALGIYRHRLTITSATAGHTGSIRGISQNAAPADTMAGAPWDGVVGTAGTADNTIQSSSATTTPARFNQWYGFGKQEEIYWRNAGVAATTAEYVATYSVESVAVTDIGSYAPGQIVIDTVAEGHTTDTDFWVYDNNLDAIAGFGNDDESTLAGSPGGGLTLQSFLTRSYAPGTYYIAMSTFTFANNMASASDDDFRTGSLMDFPNVAVSSSTTATTNMAFTILDSIGGTATVANTHDVYGVNWFRFNVVPEPGTLLALGTGLMALGLARRKRSR